jgi:glycosyltransferase involved in cell wall biosynthesis
VRTVNFVVPDGIDDLARPSGGNTYDRHVCRELVSLGWSVHEHAVPGSWPRPDAASFTALACALERIPGDAIVLLDGLVASTAPEVLVSQSRRLRLIVLVHMLLGHRPVDDDTRIREGTVVSAAAAIITTSAWARRRLLELYSLPADRVHVARPGVDAADLASGTGTGGALLCVAAVTLGKGYDVLLDALEKLLDVSWHCVCVGSLDRDPAFVECLRHRSSARGLGDRVRLAGTRTGAELDRSYAAADLVVLASRSETYGMVITEALGRGLPVLAAEVGGLPEALGYGQDGVRPGLLVPQENPAAFAAALRRWLSDAELRRLLRRAARERRNSLSGWSTTASIIAGVLAAAAR